ncbi:putative SnoaL-like aldol condensation-catalyzing enzyme [Kitasatospora sp. MAA19]|uniref:nuclear transport factor 2 family protein n=1 Tax=unclassified Kitasatospora TaxID=2633591 RepID=UPI002475062D|nr:ester cyclase [Kitasatospora sp. MAA19]MDH6707964.1 putative SnoaL-like aldol condensation-catalyzing enzyme [Kitasatospora sp. MAA19]
MSTEEQNEDLVREAFDTLFNQRDYAAAERFWSPDYIQHSAHIPPGRDGLFGLIKSLPAGFGHEAELIAAQGDMVIVRGRFTGHGLPAPWIAVDFVRVENGLLAEHWDVIEDEATREQSASGLPMYGDTFPEDR